MADLTLGQRIAEERKKLGISQEGLGEKLGVSRQAISKWESDGAVPEIDKLIALSKLFGVTVGWLLGVEETAPQGADTLSEKQLQMVEQIVKQYQASCTPFPVFTKWQHILLICIVASIFICLFAMQITDVKQTTALSHKVDIPMYNGLSSRVTILEDYLDIEAKASSNLLAQYSFEKHRFFSVAENAMSSTILLKFSAVPTLWREGDTAYLSARISGREVYRHDCSWDGAVLTADMSVAMQNGYEYALILYHADGSQEQQMLYDEGAQNLFDHFAITAEVVPGKFNYKNGVLTLSDYEISVHQPAANYGYVQWKKLEFVLYRCDLHKEEEIGRDTVLDASSEEDLGVLETDSLRISNLLIQFRDVEVPKDANLELRLYAELNNGDSREITAHLLCHDGNGGLRFG